MGSGRGLNRWRCVYWFWPLFWNNWNHFEFYLPLWSVLILLNNGSLCCGAGSVSWTQSTALLVQWKHSLVSHFICGDGYSLHIFFHVICPWSFRDWWTLYFGIDGLMEFFLRLSLKMVLVLALSSLKRIRDLQAQSVSPSSLDFIPGLVKIPLVGLMNWLCLWVFMQTLLGV